MKNRKRILAAILTAIMTISILPANSFASEAGENDTAEAAVEAVSVSDEEQEVESTVEDISEETASETEEEPSVIDETEEVSEPETTEEVEAVVEEEDLAAEEAEETVEADEVVETVEDDIETVDTESEGPKTLKAEGKDYIVTVTYNDSALLPDDVKIEVEEIKENARKYDAYCDDALEAVQKENDEAEEINYIRLFDITLEDGEGHKVQPETAVDVQIRLKDVDTVEDNTQIVHFAGKEEKPEVIEPAIENDTVAFEAEGFSIYAVVTTGDYARLTVNFNVSEGNTTTMYVKKKDITDGKLNQVLYDPGVPVQEGKKFLGWTDKQNWTSLSLEELEASAKTIDGVRSDVTAKLNAGITDGQSVNYYPIMVNIFELYYQDEAENTFKTESLLSATNNASTTVDLAYTITGGTATQNFIGWKVKGGDGTVYPNGTEITISQDTILIPAIGEGAWLWFNSNAGGAGVSEASYTAPQFVAAGGTPTEPAAPTRPGYTFDGWFDAAEGGNPFDFSKQLSYYTPDSEGYVWAYAHWTAKQDATYKVVIWAQKVTDDKNAADDAKTYDYKETYTVSGAVAGTILDETELRKSSNNYFEKDNEYFGADDLDNGSKAFEYARIKVVRGIGNDGNGVNPDDSTVVNVYYDRALMTIACGEAAVVGPGTSLPEQDYYEQTTNTSGTIYGRVNGEYVQLTRSNAGKRVQWGKYVTGTPTYYDPAPQYIWTNRTSAVNNSTSNRYEVSAVEQANASTINNASAGTSFTRINTSTMVFQTGSQGSQFYARVGSSAELAACYVLQNYAYTVQSTGEEYTGIIYKKSTKPAVMTGLYGQNLSQYGYSWPRPSSGGTWDGIAFLDTFTGSFFGGDAFGETPNSILLTKDPQATNLTMIFYLQDKENPDQYNEVDRASYALDNVQGGKVKITERILGGISKDYSWATSDSMPTTWHTEVDNNGRTEFTRTDAGGDANTFIHIRYNRVTNNIIFMQGGDELKVVGPVRYEESLAEYEDDAPDSSAVNVGDDEFFAGWFEDPEGVKRVKWDELTMPLGNKIIYAVVRHSEYHVFVDMDGGTLPEGQNNQFWENWGRTIDPTNFMNATKTDDQGNRYTLVGYYTDEDLTQPWNFDIPLNEEYLFYKYDDTLGENGDPARASEYFGEGNYDVGYDNVVGIFRLWAKWKNESILNKGGLNIRYRNPNATDNLYVDSMHYADMSDVIAAQAPTEDKWPEGKRFDGWQLKEGKVYQPGDTFVADSDDAVIENNKYWITLTAVYVDKENRTPTHVTWYNNYDGGIYHTDDNYSINEPITIYGTGAGQSIPTRDGYKFLGWAKDTERENAEDAPNTSTDEPTANFLEYKNGKFYLPGTNTEVTAVAADEVLPYEALYAIWQKDRFYIYHSSTPDAELEAVDMPESGEFNITAKVADKMLYGGYYEYIESGNHKGDAITKNPGTSMVPEKDHIYYLKEVDARYLRPAVYLTWSEIHGGLIRNLYGFVDIDTEDDYTDAGLDIGGEEFHIWGEGKLTDGTIIVTKQGEGQEDDILKAKDLFTIDNAVFGYTDLTSKISGGARLLINGYYITKDGVKVTGYKTRVIQFAENDPAYGAPVWTGWNSNGNTICGLATVTPTYTPVSRSLTAGKFTLMRSLKINAPAEKIEYTITKVYDPGVDLQVVEEGDHSGEITYAEKSGYYFAGWYKDGAFTEPADFSDVKSDLTVYAKYVKASDISASFSRKSSKSGTTTFNAEVAVKGKSDLADVTVMVNGKNASVLGNASVKKTGSGKNVKYTTQYKGTASVSGLSLISSFTASVSWTTADGTAVAGPAYKCTYILGLVTVK